MFYNILRLRHYGKPFMSGWTNYRRSLISVITVTPAWCVTDGLYKVVGILTHGLLPP